MLAALILTGVGASLAFGQELQDSAGLQQGLCDIEIQAHALKPQRKSAPQQPIEHKHRLGHPQDAVDTSTETAELPNISAYPVHGIDVSHHDGDIQWAQVKAAGISFAFIKATEGADFVDPDFQANWQGASGAAVAKGAYHFYNFCKTGAVQAANFIKTVPREDGVLPMVIDLEASEDCAPAQMPAKPVFLKDFAAFVSSVTAAYGAAPILYVNLVIYDQYLSGAASGFKLWIADPAHTSPHMPAGESWTFWQYGWHGSVAGIAAGTEVDLDVFNGDAQALARLAQPQSFLAQP
jgi:lysozyme